MIKRLLGILLCCIIVTIAVGCGKADSSRDSENAEHNGTIEEKDRKSDSNTQTQSKLSYEISDVGFKYQTDSSDTMRYHGYVEIINTGDCDIYMSKCTFDLEDNDGHLLQSNNNVFSFSSVIAPGEKGYFFNFMGSTTIDKGVSLDNGIKLVPQVKLTKAEAKPAAYPVSDVSVLTGDYDEIKVIGRIENTSNKDIEYLYVNVIFYDASGKVIAIAGEDAKNIEAGQKGSFEVYAWGSAGFLKLEDISDVKVIAEEVYTQQ